MNFTPFSLKLNIMYKVKKGKEGARVGAFGFCVVLKEATQEQLEHLHQIGHPYVEFEGDKKPPKKAKNDPKEPQIDTDNNE